MISISLFFWFMVGFFALIGYLRGWQREVIAFSGLVASIALLSQFGDDLTRLVGAFVTARNSDLDPQSALMRQRFWIQALFHALVAFFSYQVVARIANQATGGRLSERLRANLEKQILGALIGAFNGYLFIGGLWGFLEYRLTDSGYAQLGPNELYPFGADLLTRPIGDAAAATLAAFLPQGVFSPTIWLILFFVSFFFVLVALI